MADNARICVVIPAYLEGRFIADVVKRVRQHIPDVMVIDDGSADDTSKCASEAGAVVIRHSVNRGKGAAIKTGLRAALDQGFQFALLLDGDGQHLPEEIPLFVEAAESTGNPIILGNRMANVREMPPVRRLTNQFMSGLISKVCGQAIPDTQCGFRMLRADVIPLMFCDSQNYDYETEMLLIASKEGFRITSVPVSTVYGEEKSKIHPIRDTIRFFRLLRRYR